MIKKAGKTLRFLFKLGFWVLFLLLIAGLGVFAYFAKDLPDPAAAIKREPVQSTKIYARDGKTLLFELSARERRTLVSLDEIAPVMIQATLVTEDRRFYQHPGIDPLALLKSIWQNFRAGQVVRGGSTITQQFIKNAILSGERTLVRKIKEVILSLELERRYSKDQILAFYLNTIPYGSGALGVEAAAQTFFGKPAGELNLAEAATLAALPKSPTFYSPFGSNLDKLKARRNFIIGQMAQLGFVSQDQAKTAQQTELEFSGTRVPIKAPHFVMYVQELLEKKFGKEVVQNQGLEVITTLDWELQKEAQRQVKSWVSQIKSRFFASNGALVALDPQTGQILAMVGSADFWNFKNDGQVNVALRLRQPGSAIKPIIYARAFQKGYLPETIIFDLPTSFPGGQGRPDYEPKNYTLKYLGPISMREALAQSINVVAVKTLYLVGVKEALNLARQMGLTTFTEPQRYGLSLVLGGAEVKLLELTEAYSIFSQDGIRHSGTPFLEIKSSSGEILETYKDQAHPVLEPKIARQINDILSDNQARAPLFGLNSPLYVPDRPAAVKTGTTDQFRDAWTIGYSPNLVVGAWVGNNDNSPMVKAAGGYAVAPLWNNFFRFAAKKLELEPVEFIKPEAVKSDKPMVGGNFANERVFKVDKITGKLATQYTPPELVEERIFRETHTILHYIFPDNPQGPIPSPKERDPMYSVWEKTVQEWLARQPDSASFNQAPPQEFDDVHKPENRPQVKIISPFGQIEAKKGTVVNFKVQVKARFPIQQVDFYANENLIGTDFKAPFSVPVQLKNEGQVTLKATAFDSVLNSGKAQISVRVTGN